MQNNHWLILSPISDIASENLIEYSPIMRQILFNRGYSTAEEARAFLGGQTLDDTSPYGLKDMLKVIDRIRKAITAFELISVYGDYDVDGVTATALLVQVLRAIGANVEPYIPNRFDEGYGLNNDALDHLRRDGVGLVITVDCGIRSHGEVLHAKKLGLDLIITDHHEPASGDLPEAYAIINPKQTGDNYPDKYLAGVGVAFKIAQALLDGVDTDSVKLQMEDLLDLVALGTVADLAPLVGENRMLVRLGLNEMKQPRRQGLFSLANVAGVKMTSVNASNIGFALGPRLNAAGRMDTAHDAYDLLMAQNLNDAATLATRLDDRNRERQDLTRVIQAEAEKIALAANPSPWLLFAVSPEFNSGVVGLAASRLTEKYYRPAIVGQVSEDSTRCSCRSIPEFHITHVLDQCSDLMVRYGGHAAAAGFTVQNENLPELQKRLENIAQKTLENLDLRVTYTADVEVPLASLKPSLLNELGRLQPTGYGNPEAVFVTRDVVVKTSRTVGVDGKHLKLTLSDGRFTFDAIGFRMGHLMESLPGRVDIMYTFESNEYNGRVSLQLNVKDIRPAGSGEH